jgi:hypothetical protein
MKINLKAIIDYILLFESRSYDYATLTLSISPNKIKFTKKIHFNALNGFYNDLRRVEGKDRMNSIVNIIKVPEGYGIWLKQTRSLYSITIRKNSFWDRFRKPSPKLFEIKLKE